MIPLLSFFAVCALIALLTIGALMPFGYGTHQSGKDNSQIEADAAAGKDSLKEDWHKSNFKRRAKFAVIFSVGLSGLLWLLGFRWWFFLPYLLYFTVAFGFTFTYSLNRARGLDAWYVSRDARAAVSDRLLVWAAQKYNIFIRQKPGRILTHRLATPEHLARSVYTGLLLAVIVLFAGAAWINCLLIVDK